MNIRQQPKKKRYLVILQSNCKNSYLHHNKLLFIFGLTINKTANFHMQLMHLCRVSLQCVFKLFSEVHLISLLFSFSNQFSLITVLYHVLPPIGCANSKHSGCNTNIALTLLFNGSLSQVSLFSRRNKGVIK